MYLLVLGLIVFIGSHAFTINRSWRDAAIARLGSFGYRSLYSLASLVGLVLIVWGYVSYRDSGYIHLYETPVALRHLSLLMLLPIFVLLASAYLPGRIKAAAKHPMLLAVKIWAFTHFLVNGDLGSVLLFGSFLAWAVVARIAARGREEALPGAPAGAVVGEGWTTNDKLAIGIGLAAYAGFLFWLHPVLIGVPALPR
jgi:uncharacterized membrane protein